MVSGKLVHENDRQPSAGFLVIEPYTVVGG
jgi:hypothetical protein